MLQCCVPNTLPHGSDDAVGALAHQLETYCAKLTSSSLMHCPRGCTITASGFYETKSVSWMLKIVSCNIIVRRIGAGHRRIFAFMIHIYCRNETILFREVLSLAVLNFAKTADIFFKN
jgi:hypothetical protein